VGFVCGWGGVGSRTPRGGGASSTAQWNGSAGGKKRSMERVSGRRAEEGRSHAIRDRCEFFPERRKKKRKSAAGLMQLSSERGSGGAGGRGGRKNHSKEESRPMQGEGGQPIRSGREKRWTLKKNPRAWENNVFHRAPKKNKKVPRRILPEKKGIAPDFYKGEKTDLLTQRK